MTACWSIRDRVAGDPHIRSWCARGDAAKLDYLTFLPSSTPTARVSTRFSVDGERFFIARPEKTCSGAAAAAGRVRVCSHERRARVRRRARAFAAITGFHLHEWYRDNVRCGRCGKLLAYSHTERALECRSCGNIVYPKIAPAVIVAVVDGDKICLPGCRGTRTARKRALVAGFVEIGETAEQTVEREVREEVGLRGQEHPATTRASPGVRENLLPGYFCELDGDAHHHAAREDELGYGAGFEGRDHRERSTACPSRTR